MDMAGKAGPEEPVVQAVMVVRGVMGEPVAPVGMAETEVMVLVVVA